MHLKMLPGHRQARLIAGLGLTLLSLSSACTRRPGGTSDLGTPDLGTPDLAAPADLSAPPDLTPPADLTIPPDLTTPGPSISEFTRAGATAVCGALFRCCTRTSIDTYFSGYLAAFQDNTALQALAPQLPPQRAITAAECPDLLRQMFDIVPFPTWVAQVQAGHVEYDASNAQRCIDNLQRAACGLEVGNAVFDSTCFGYSPPGGGSEQRRMFRRTRTAGASCDIILDGLGGAFYGTCDPTQAFCCYLDPQQPSAGCQIPGARTTGTCQTAGGNGASCRVIPPLQLCITGASCVGSSCMVEGTQALTVGQTCINLNGILLGQCQNSYCDALGTRRCEALKADGSSCLIGFECQSGACVNNLCGPPTFCAGTGG